ncbi:hypothetical protein ACL00T_17245 [Curtobacterium flaccumfaciens]
MVEVAIEVPALAWAGMADAANIAMAAAALVSVMRPARADREAGGALATRVTLGAGRRTTRWMRSSTCSVVARAAAERRPAGSVAEDARTTACTGAVTFAAFGTLAGFAAFAGLTAFAALAGFSDLAAFATGAVLLRRCGPRAAARSASRAARRDRCTTGVSGCWSSSGAVVMAAHHSARLCRFVQALS